MQLIREAKQFFGDAGFQPFGYTGYQKEEAGGLYYAQARRYDADTGRFISEDKVKGFITMPVTLNAYGYCWGNPMGYVDVDGRWPYAHVMSPVEPDRQLGKLAENSLKDTTEDTESADYIGVVYLVNNKGAFGNGYAALLLVKNNGWAEFYSYADAVNVGAITTGSEGYLSTAFDKNNKIGTVNVDSFTKSKNVFSDNVEHPNERVVDNYTYTNGVYIPITNDEGIAMHDTAMKIRENPGEYNLWNHNCGQVAQMILQAGGKDFAATKFDWFNTRPNSVYENITKDIDKGNRKGWRYGAIEDLTIGGECEDDESVN